MLENNLPTLDLHGETRESTRYLLRDFIKDNYKMKNKKILIIHGIGEGILKKEVHIELKNNNLIESYKLDNFNSGCTIAIIIDKK